MTFWKDCWIAILFIWICSLSINIFRNMNNTDRISYHLRLTAIIVLISLTILVRHNAIIIYPCFFIILWLILESKKPRIKLLLTVSPLIVYLVFNLFLYQLINVKKTYEGRKVLALEISGICYESMDNCKKFPFINKHINVEDMNKHSFTQWKEEFWRKKIYHYKLLY